MLSHLTFGHNDAGRARAFYDAALAPLGLGLHDDYGDAFAYAAGPGPGFRLWIVPPFDGLPATWGNGSHLALLAAADAAVDAFHAAALAHGGRDEGAPGLRPRYSDDYYAAYARDPDGNKLQAVHYRNGRAAESAREVVSHVTVGTGDFARARAFYDAALAPLGLARIADDDEGWGYGAAGTEVPVFYAHRPFDGRPASWGNGTHVAFLAPGRAAVDAFHAAALAEGGLDEGAPGLRPQYAEGYYGAYVRDPDGNKLQAVCYESV